MNMAAMLYDSVHCTGRHGLVSGSTRQLEQGVTSRRGRSRSSRADGTRSARHCSSRRDRELQYMWPGVVSLRADGTARAHFKLKRRRRQGLGSASGARRGVARSSESRAILMRLGGTRSRGCTALPSPSGGWGLRVSGEGVCPSPWILVLATVAIFFPC